MQAGFLIEILSWKSWVVFEKSAVAVRVFVRQVGAEGVGVFPAPDRGVALVYDDSRGVEVVGVDVVDLNRTGGGGFLDHGNRYVFQPYGFLPHQPIVGWRGCGCIVAVFPNQLPSRVIEEHKLRTQRAGLGDALPEGVVFVIMRFAIVDRAVKCVGGIPHESDRSVAQRIAGAVKAVGFDDRTGGVQQAVAGGFERIRIDRTAKLTIDAVAVGVIIPKFKPGVVRLADEAIQHIVIVAAVVHRIGVGRLGDATGGIVGERAGSLPTRWVLSRHRSRNCVRTFSHFLHIKLSKFASRRIP